MGSVELNVTTITRKFVFTITTAATGCFLNRKESLNNFILTSVPNLTNIFCNIAKIHAERAQMALLRSMFLKITENFVLIKSLVDPVEAI